MVSDNARASLLMLGSMAAFVMNDMLVKAATASIEPAQVMALRGVAASFLLLGFGAWRNALPGRSGWFHPLLLCRVVADIGTTICYISALRHLPLANASAIFQALPLTITLGAALFLGEPVGWRRWLAIGIGFLGVLVIIRPAAEGFNVYAVLVLASVAFAAARDLVTRRMPADISSLHVASTTSVAVCLVGFLLLPVVGWKPMTPTLWVFLLLAAFAVATGYCLIVAAMRIGDLGFVAPFRYSMLIFAFLFGWLVFGEAPDALELVGAAVVVGSGLYMFRREKRKHRPPLAVVADVDARTASQAVAQSQPSTDLQPATTNSLNR